MENVLANTISTWLIIIQSDMINTVSSILSDVFLLFFQPLSNFIQSKHKTCTPNTEEEKLFMRKEDIKMVMERLGILIVCDSSNGDNMLLERYDGSELSRLFEEEPSLEELKEAFDIFDENKDGFIDSLDLQKVLCCLGVKEGLQVEKCTRMIKAVKKDDDDGDLKIDLHEFVRFMDKFFG
eukprot:XP_002522453.2 probable calcium-binding protein CML45 [Ricinus communis]